MSSVFGLTLDVYPHQRLQDKDVLPLSTVQIHEYSAQSSFQALETFVVSLIENKVFIPGSMTRQALSSHIKGLRSTCCDILVLHREDSAQPSGLSLEPYSEEWDNYVVKAVQRDGRGMACILSARASEGLAVRRAGDTENPFSPYCKSQEPGLQEVAAMVARKQAYPMNGGIMVLQVRNPAPFVCRRLLPSSYNPFETLSLSVLTELYGEVRLEVPSSTTVGEVLDRIQCSEGISPRDRQLVIYSASGNFDLGTARVLSDMASPLSYFAPPGIGTLPLTLRGEIDALARAEKRESRRHGRAKIREMQERLFDKIGGRKEGKFYLFAEKVADDLPDRSRAVAGENTVVLQRVRPDSTVEELMADVERRMGIAQENQQLFYHGRPLLKRLGDPNPVAPSYLLPDALEREEDRPAWASPESAGRKRVGDPLTLLDYRVDPDSTIRLREVGREMQIFVRVSFRRTITLEVRSADTFDIVKAKIEAKEGIPAGQQRLTWGGRYIEDRRTLADYNVQKEANLDLSYRFAGFSSEE